MPERVSRGQRWGWGWGRGLGWGYTRERSGRGANARGHPHTCSFTPRAHPTPTALLADLDRTDIGGRNGLVECDGLVLHRTRHAAAAAAVVLEGLAAVGVLVQDPSLLPDHHARRRDHHVPRARVRARVAVEIFLRHGKPSFVVRLAPVLAWRQRLALAGLRNQLARKCRVARRWRGPVRLGSVRLGSVRLGSVRLVGPV